MPSRPSPLIMAFASRLSSYTIKDDSPSFQSHLFCKLQKDLSKKIVGYVIDWKTFPIWASAVDVICLPFFLLRNINVHCQPIASCFFLRKIIIRGSVITFHPTRFQHRDQHIRSKKIFTNKSSCCGTKVPPSLPTQVNKECNL